MLRTLLLGATALICACAPAVGWASQSAKLEASLTPERLGHYTTFGFGFQITSPDGAVPSPVLAVGLSYPKNLGVAISELGIEHCVLEDLVANGLRICPTDSRMGFGSATVEIPVGPVIVRESAHLDVVRAPQQEGHLAMIFDTEGASPVQAEIALPGVLHEASEPFGGKVAIELPLIPSLPEASDVSIVDLHAAIGPAHLVYHEQLNGRTIYYRPHGIKMPRHCPPGGFQFAATFAFLDGSRTSAHTLVPCPRASTRAQKRSRRP
jgi:hypothetical protein